MPCETKTSTRTGTRWAAPARAVLYHRIQLSLTVAAAHEISKKFSQAQGIMVIRSVQQDVVTKYELVEQRVGSARVFDGLLVTFASLIVLRSLCDQPHFA